MPYVQRDFGGKIKGLYANPQSGYAEEFLLDENVEVVAYSKKHPAPKIKPLSKEEKKKMYSKIEALSKTVTREDDKMRNAVYSYLIRWSELEIALSALLYEILYIEAGSSKVAYALYYSLTGFHARQTMLLDAIKQLVIEKPELKEVLQRWKDINGEGLEKARKIRNIVAHGSPLRICLPKKTYVVYAPPAFDVLKVDNLIKKGSLPGLTSSELFDEVKKIGLLIECIDAVNELLRTFREYGVASLKKTIPILEGKMKKIPSLANKV